jgi:hypothetical protein
MNLLFINETLLIFIIAEGLKDKDFAAFTFALKIERLG